jgi:hypothetical protein
VNPPTALSVLADHIRDAYTLTRLARRDWIDGTLALAQALAEARAQFTADQQFAHWLSDRTTRRLREAQDAVEATSNYDALIHAWEKEEQLRFLRDHLTAPGGPG